MHRPANILLPFCPARGLGSIVAAILLAIGVAGCGGVDDQNGSPPGAAASPAESKPVRIEVIVVGPDSQPLAGVQATMVGGTAGASTGADGSAAIDLPAAATVLVKLSKAGYTDSFKQVSFRAGSTATRVSALLRPRDPTQLLDAAAGGQLVGRDGATVELPAGALVDAQTGAAVTGSVDIAMTPINVSGDELRAFPGGFAGIDGSGARQLLASYGTTEFMLTQGGRRLNLAPGRTATIELPIYTPLHSAGVAVAAGDTIPLWSLDETSGNWKQEGNGVVVASASSPTGLSMRATVGHFSWWNCDIGIDRGYYDLHIETPDVEDDERVPDPRVPPDDLDIDTDPNHYLEGIDKLIHIDARTADDRLFRQAGIDFKAAFDDRNYKPARKPDALSAARATLAKDKGSVYTVARGLIAPGNRPVAVTACSRVKRGGPGFTPVDACGTAVVTVATGATLSVTIKLRVGLAQDVPYITVQPAPASVQPGQKATFTVSAIRGFSHDAAGLTYQWTKNGDPIPAATAASYITPDATLADDSSFYAVTVTSPAGTTLSLRARLSVAEPPPPPPPPPPPSAGDRWVDVAAGNDANAGSDAAPLKTISAAIRQVPSGATVWLKDGIWGPADDPALMSGANGLNCVALNATNALVAGTTIRAVNPGRVTVRSQSYTAFCLQTTQLRGLQIEAITSPRESFTILATRGDSLLSGVTVTGGRIGVIANGTGTNRMNRLRIEAAGLANYGNIADASGLAVYLAGPGSEVIVDGGRFGELPPTSTALSTFCGRAGSFTLYNGARLVLNKVDLIQGPSRDAKGTLGVAINACEGSQVELNDTQIEGFAGTDISSAGVLLRASTLTTSGATLLTGNRFGIKLTNSTVALGAGTKIERSLDSGVYLSADDSRSQPSRITLSAGSSVRSNGGHGLKLGGNLSSPILLDITSADISNNVKAGLFLSQLARCTVRGTTFAQNLEQSVLLQGPSSCDLGTAASPGANLFQSTGPNVTFSPDRFTTTTLLAVGNTWLANEQGADGRGRYALPTGQTVLEIGAPVTGRNYRIDAGGRLRLAE